MGSGWGANMVIRKGESGVAKPFRIYLAVTPGSK